MFRRHAAVQIIYNADSDHSIHFPLVIKKRTVTMRFKLPRLVPCFVFFVVGSISIADAAITTVGVFDENVVQVNRVDVSATKYTAGQVSSDVASAFAAGQGGVIDFDNGTITDPNRLEATFSAGTKILHVRNDERTWSIGNLGTGTAGALSGGRVLFNGAPNPFPVPYLNRIIFDDVTDQSGVSTGEVVTTFGLIVLDLNTNVNGGANDLEFLVTFSDNSTASLMHTVPGSFNQNDTFFGYQAPAGQSIKEIEISATNNLATDDWAFVVSPSAVPEPSSFVLLGMFGVAAVMRRRQR